MLKILFVFLYVLLIPLLGGLLSGIDRKVTARLQGRIGPPVFQPFFDVLKLLQKETLVVRKSQNFYIFFSLIFVIFTTALFAWGANLLLVIFALTLSSIFFTLAGFKASSPYSFTGSQRELIQIASYEPAVLLSAIGMYMITKSFDIDTIFFFNKPLYIPLAGIILAYLFILPIKLRKSPFDLSTSHHAHQELVKGITTEFSGRALAMIELTHWYESTIALGIVFLFFAWNPLIGILAAVLAFFFVIIIDNSFARVKWQKAFTSSWLVALIFGVGNIILLSYLAK
ncbi:MAG TPA: complex I subunit 1 family protein [Chitinispirillaceae bacterium]|nr:complex I subunit 1 family protein [Chitinispirillaceae bacterium]